MTQVKKLSLPRKIYPDFYNKMKDMPVKYYITLFVNLLMTLFAPAQQVVVTELPTQKLLPVAHIHHILQDSEGYMWYATEGGGVCRDNGYQIDVFRSDLNTPNLLSSNDITCLTEDKNHHIWFGTKRGLYKLDKTNYSITEITNEELRKQTIHAIRAIHDGTVWVSAEGIIYHYSNDGKLLGSYPSQWKGHRQNVSDFYEDSKHTLWVMQWGGGLLEYNPSTDSFLPHPWTCGASPTQMTEDRQNNCYWIATWGKGIVQFVPSSDTQADTDNCTLQPATLEGNEPTPHKSQILGLLKDSRQGVLWVSAMNDLYAYQIIDNKLHPISTETFLPKGKKILDRIIEDRSGNVWVPGYSPHSFILSFDSNKIKRYPTPAMSTITGYPVMADRTIREEDYFWIWQGRTGLSLYHPASEQISFASDFPDETGKYYIIKCIEKCRTQQGIWAASGNASVLHLQHEGMKMKRIQEIQLPDARQIRVLNEDNQGNLWIGTENAIYQYSISDENIKRVHNDAGAINGIATSPDKGIYYITEALEFAYLTPDGKVHTIHKGENYSSIIISPDSIIWIATLEGNVYSYHPQSQTLTKEDNACNANGDAVKSMTVDNFGHLWILADQYVKEYNPRNHSFRILYNSDRFIQVDYFLSIRKIEDGTICLGGIGAFCLVTPSIELDQSPNDVKPVISSIKIDGNRRIMGINTQQIELAPDNINVEVSFSTLEHLYAGQISYAYRLKGWDTNWNHLPPGINTAYFTKLPKGNYTLEIKATDIHGCWAQPTSCLQIHRLPAWYETWWAYTLYILSIALITTGLLKIYFSRLHKKQQEQIEEQLTQMKFRFFTNISHELRTPLTLIITPLSSLLTDIQDGKLKQQLSSIYRSAQELLQLVNQLLDFRKLEVNGEKLHLMNGEIYEFVSSTCEVFRTYASSQQIEYAILLPRQGVNMYFDRDKVHRILYNLLNNAFKFTPSGGSITVSADTITKDGTQYICIRIEDTGKGIEAEVLPRIFDRYYQIEASENRQATAGSGIGLHIVKEYISLHHGFIEVDSKRYKGSEFRIYLPTHLADDRLLLEEESESKATASSGNRKTILLVEDNEEFRQFMYRQLSQKYQVWEASNGEEAETIANKKEVDIVVSDVMMPGIDGFELCHRLKQNVKTSHIFIILLTARAGDESMLEGYKSGADCYLTKPFNMEILDNRIHHLLALQQKRRQIFLTEIEVNTEDLTTSKVDEEFLKKAVALVEKNLDNSEYSVELFSDDMCMSRMNLYRKLQSITGQKPTEFIRSIRLKKAARLLTDTELSVVEISEKVGFATPSYFSKCFKEMFGVLPTQYH